MHRSLTAQLPLSRYRIDRDHLTRERPRLFEELAEDPRTRVMRVWIDGDMQFDREESQAFF